MLIPASNTNRRTTQKMLGAQGFRAMARKLIANEFESSDPYCFVHFNLENFKGFNE